MIDICDFAVGLSRQLYGRSIASERPGPPPDRDLAPARAGRRHQRVQLPRRGVELERRARARLRRPGALEAVRADAAHRDRDDPAPRARGRAVRRRARRALRARDRRRRPRRAARRGRPDPARLRHGLDARWARSSRRASPPGSDARSSSSAATTRRSSRRAPTSTWSCARVLFAAVGTAGQRCTSLRRLIVHETIADDARSSGSPTAYRSVPIGDPREPGTLVGPLVTGEAFGRLEAALGEARRGRRRGRRRRRPRARRSLAGRLVRASRRSSGCRRRRTSSGSETFAPILYVLTYASSTRRSRSRTACRRASPRRSSPPTCVRPSGSSPPRARTAGSRTSTSARAGPRSAARSAARRRRAAAASPARTPGRRTCAGRPRRSTSRTSFRSRRASVRRRGRSRSANRARRVHLVSAVVASQDVDQAGSLIARACPRRPVRTSTCIRMKRLAPVLRPRCSPRSSLRPPVRPG